MCHEFEASDESNIPTGQSALPRQTRCLQIISNPTIERQAAEFRMRNIVAEAQDDVNLDTPASSQMMRPASQSQTRRRSNSKMREALQIQRGLGASAQQAFSWSKLAADLPAGSLLSAEPSSFRLGAYTASLKARWTSTTTTLPASTSDLELKKLPSTKVVQRWCAVVVRHRRQQRGNHVQGKDSP